ncbi:MAG TPA: DUF4383 domain-containing protein [Gammaproteobacteria bacterium]
MNVQTFALIAGLLFLLIGVAGFVPGLVTLHTSVEHQLTIGQGAGDLFGLFAVNVAHNIVHIASGVWGLLVSRNIDAAVVYARSVAIIYALFVFMGLVPQLSTAFGLVPLHGNDIWLHGLIAAAAAYFGFLRHPDADHHAARPAHRT